MSDTIRRKKYREIDPTAIEHRKELDKIRIQEALEEAENHLEDEDSPNFIENSYNLRG